MLEHDDGTIHELKQIDNILRYASRLEQLKL